jgi:hypothetical protein
MALLQTGGKLFSKLMAALWHFFKLAGRFFKLAGRFFKLARNRNDILHCGRKHKKTSLNN